MTIYTVIAPTPIDPLPPLPVRGAPDWSAKAHAYVVKLKDDVQPQQNSLSLNVWNNALAAQEQADIGLLYPSDAADDLLRVDLGGRRNIKKKTLR